jgi:hypothetical protein
MKSENELSWNNLTDRLLASLESSRRMEHQTLVESNADAAKQQRERNRPKEEKLPKKNAKDFPKTNNKFQTRMASGS